MEYRYLRLRVPRGQRPSVPGAWGVFSPQIGEESDTFVAIASAAPADADALADDAIVTTVRPVDDQPLTDDGVYAHRWFDIDAADWPEFLALSEGAWPGFEGANPGVRIVGFFRCGDDRVLLVTRYPSLASWETSRNAPDDAGGANFRRRHQLTKSTIVRTYRLLP
jgi:hypothetical protein